MPSFQMTNTCPTCGHEHENLFEDGALRTGQVYVEETSVDPAMAIDRYNFRSNNGARMVGIEQRGTTYVVKYWHVSAIGE